MSYCTVIQNLEPIERKLLHKVYHDKLYGFPIDDDNELFCRLILEINQAGLSWETILKKEITFRLAYDNFVILRLSVLWLYFHSLQKFYYLQQALQRKTGSI